MEKKRSNFEITYAAIVRIDENVKNKKEMEQIVLSDVPNEIYPRLEDLFISLVNKSGFPEVKIERKVDFEKVGNVSFEQKKEQRKSFDISTSARYIRLTFVAQHKQKVGYPQGFAFVSELEVYGSK